MSEFKSFVKDTLKFIEFISRLPLIKRDNPKLDKSPENDAEHSYQLANVLKYAPVHDIVEIYASDNHPFNNAEVLNKMKQDEFESMKKTKVNSKTSTCSKKSEILKINYMPNLISC